MLSTGDLAPDFTLPRDGGEMVNLSSLKPQQVVLYFYPRDDTPGCTVEALEFTALASEFAAAGAAVIGISKDPIKSHDKFVAKHSLGITLVSDAESDLCERYGVWVEKSMYGKTSMGIERATFLVDGEGKLKRIWRKVKAQGHAAEVLDAVRSA
ncbi:MAG: thioredoxin-dependent thiol peroxidase [Roseinatronobacter sp.]